MPDNVQLSDANFSRGPETGFFYSCDYSEQRLIQVQADGSFVDDWPATNAQFRNPVKELHYDGTFFWTLEDLPSDLGIAIKKWRLYPFQTPAFPDVPPTEFRWQDQMTLLHKPDIRWAADAFAIEHYHRTLLLGAVSGDSVIRLNDVSNVNAGDKLYLTSSYGGFEDNQEEITVFGVNTLTKDITFSKPGGLENSYNFLDPVNFAKTIFVFSDNSITGYDDGQGALLRYSYPAKDLVNAQTGGAFTSVTAADFDDTTLSWVRSFQIMELDISNPTFDFSNSQQANLLEDNLFDLIEVFDLIADYDQNEYLKLQLKESEEDLGTGTMITTSYTDSKYSYQSQPTASRPNSMSMSFSGRFTKREPIGAPIDIITEVRDQYNFPVFNETVRWEATINTYSDAGTPGTMIPPEAITNASGIAETTYNPSDTTTDIILDVTAWIPQP